MARNWLLANVLWLAACGRLGFDTRLAGPDAEVGPRAQLALSTPMTAECGVAQPPPGTLAIDNIGDAALVISGATATGGFTIATPLPLTVAPGASATLAIQPPAAVIGTDLAGATKTGTLVLATNDSATPDIGLTATIVGANVGFVSQAIPITTVMFSGVGACPAPQQVVMQNTGSLPATIAFTGASNVAFSGFTGGVLDAAAASPVTLTAQIMGTCTINGGYLLYTVTGSVCTTTPAALDVRIDITGTSSCICS